MEASEVFANVMPFTGLPEVAHEAPAVLAEATAQREVAEVQAAMLIAKRFPRNQAKSLDRILVACQRPTLAEGALYSYARGGTDITGPSIRLAEAIAQQWGNLQFGIRELDQRLGESTVEAYAWDLETNTRQTKTFQVKHIRRTRAKGNYTLEDPRDIYEMVANQGARRLRACILGVIPGDIVEAAVTQCEATLKAKADISPEAVKKMVEVFTPYGVTQEMIEARIQRKLESITPAQIISLRKVYNSLKDGMSTLADWFDMNTPIAQAKTPNRGRPPKATETSPVAPPPEAAISHGAPSEVSPENGTVGPRAIQDSTLEAIWNELQRTMYEEEILRQDYDVSAISELTDEAGQNIIKFLAGLPNA
jgi:hypothetical protein